MFRLLVFALLIAIIAALATALVRLFRDGGSPEAMAKSLTIRVALSVTLFVLLLIGLTRGWITPHSNPIPAIPAAPASSQSQ